MTINITNQNNFFNFIYDATTNIKNAFSNYPLKDRIKILFAGASLAALIYIAVRCFNNYFNNASRNKSFLLSTFEGEKVKFGQVRGRRFDKEDPSIAIQFQNSEVFGENGKINKGVQPLKRKFPPLSIHDTLVAGAFSNPKSIHGETTVFADKDILIVHEVIRKEKLADGGHTFGEGIYVEYTANNKAIIQQQGARGCTAATAAMLIADHGKKVDIGEVVSRNIGNNENKIRDLQNAGLTPITTQIKGPQVLEELEKQLKKNGPALVTIVNFKENLSHAIVVDEVNLKQNTVRLREPYHGWEITVTAASFLEGFHGGEIIQVQN